MAFASATNRKLDDAQAQISRLRQQVESLLKERVTPAVSDYADRAEKAYNGASDMVRSQSDYVSNQVQSQPLVAIAIAAAVGWIVGRVMR